jgi:hypothetical protein
MEACRLKMEPWRVYRPVVADSHVAFEGELDPDPHKSEMLDSDPDLSDADPQPWFLAASIDTEV